ncbi:MAG: hypothetical protein P0S95_03180 [Rhabdochlamydiaceae bacterium]|nr:hypothetical protein [Candidatus Amphrikana amoebophyrae]
MQLDGIAIGGCIGKPSVFTHVLPFCLRQKWLQLTRGGQNVYDVLPT